MDPEYLRASDGGGKAILAHITSPRAIASTVIEVDDLDNWPDKFIVTTGTLGSNGYLEAGSITEMKAHKNAGDIIIDSFEPGFADDGNTTDQVAILKQTSGWADLVADFAALVAGLTGITVPFAGAVAPDSWLICNGAAVSRATYADLFAVIGTAFGAGDGATTFNLPDLRSRVPIGVGTGTFVFTFNAADVTVATDQIAVTASPGLITGRKVRLTTTNTLPTGLALATDYYLIVVDSTHIKLASSLANALAGTAIDITGQGAGTNTATVTLTARALGDKGGEEDHALTTTEIPAHNHIPRATSSAANAPDPVGRVDAAAGSAADGFRAPAGVSFGNMGVTTTDTGGSGAHNNMQPFAALNYIIKT